MKQMHKNKKTNKSILISSISSLSGLSKADSARALNAALKAIQLSLIDEKDVILPGFGTFRIFHRPELMGRSPRSGEPMKIPAAKVTKFKVSKKLKLAIA